MLSLELLLVWGGGGLGAVVVGDVQGVGGNEMWPVVTVLLAGG